MRCGGLAWTGTRAPRQGSARAVPAVGALGDLRRGRLSAAHAGLRVRVLLQPDEVAARRVDGRAPGYDGHCRELTPDRVREFRAEGRVPVIRFRMPGHDLHWDDLVRGELSFGAEHVPDFVIVRANGRPLYTLTNPVDDALMGITHVLRGEDLLSSTLGSWPCTRR